MKTPFLLRTSFIVMILLLSVTIVKAQTTYTWTGTTSTAWATTTNWSPAGNPGSAASDVVIIPAVTNQPLVTVAPANALATLTFTGTATLTITTVTLTVTGAVANSTAAATGTVTGTGTLSCGSLSIGNGANLTFGTVVMNVSGTTTVGGGTSGTLTLSSATGAKTFIGLVTVNSGATWTESAAAIPAFRNGITNGGTFTASTGVHTFATNAQALSGTLSIPRATVTGITLTNNGTLTVGTALIGTGGLTNSATGTLNIGGTSTIITLTATAAGNTVNYTGGVQTVKATTYDNLTLSGTGAKTTTGITVNAIFEFGGNVAVTVSAVPTYGTSATLKYNKTAAFNAGTEWPTSFTGTGGIFIAGTSTGAITRNAGGPYTVSKLTISANAVLNYQRAITVSGTTDIYGTVNWASSSGTSRAEAFTGDVTLYSAAVWTEPATGNGANNTYSFAGNFTNNASTFTGSGTDLHTFSGASKTISGSAITNFPSVTFTGAYTNSGKLTVATLLTVTGVTLTNNGTITATTALSGTGGVTQGTTGILNIGAASAITTLTATATGNTVNYTGAGQTLHTGTSTYHNLSLSGSGTKTFGAAMTINGNLAISGTAVAGLGTSPANSTSATLQLAGVYQVGGNLGKYSFRCCPSK